MSHSPTLPVPPHVLAPPWAPPVGADSIVGSSPATNRLRDTVRKVARSQAMTILLQGESGTGKDLVAKALHAESERAAGPYVPINCSAIPESLMEAEFFGHEAGAYTDARTAKRGLLELADQGTAFLDEVAELAPAVQAKLLRFLEDRSFKRLGGVADVAVDARIIAGTNVNLIDAVRRGRFRADLYYRLRVVPLAVLPLRERPEDIPALARHFLEYYSRRMRRRFEEYDPEAMRRLMAHPWPGNVRELKNAIERVVLLEEGPVVRPDMLVLGDAAAAPQPAAATAPPENLRLHDLELRTLVRALELSRGNQSLAAKMLGISRDTVRYRMRKFGVQVETRVTVGHPGAAPPGA